MFYVRRYIKNKLLLLLLLLLILLLLLLSSAQRLFYIIVMCNKNDVTQWRAVHRPLASRYTHMLCHVL